jgi:hypothetical protein
VLITLNDFSRRWFMKKATKAAVSARRRLLCNPYAHIEYLEDFELETNVSRALPAAPLIEASRRRLEDPYAYLDDSGGYSADAIHLAKPGISLRTVGVANLSGNVSKKLPGGPSNRYTKAAIEKFASDLHARLWRERESLFGGISPSDPIELLDPAFALHLVGYDFSVEEGLGKYRGKGGYVEVAGLIDRPSKRVCVSRQFPTNVRTFTAAHELGHAVLHAAGGGIHRDRPLDGTKFSRDPVELEADTFATFFLMPGRLVRTRFEGLFGTDFFELNDHTAFALSSSSVEEIRSECSTLRHLSRMLVSAERFNGRHFVSLADQFRVSIEAMAIRIEELELVA